MSSLIHVLELVTLAMFGVLFYQLSACYKAYYAQHTLVKDVDSIQKKKMQSRKTSKPSSSEFAASKLSVSEPGSSKEGLLKQGPSKPVAAPVARSAADSVLVDAMQSGLHEKHQKPESIATEEFESSQIPTYQTSTTGPSAAILNDYIGEFFEDSSEEALDVSAYRAETSSASPSPVKASKSEPTTAPREGRVESLDQLFPAESRPLPAEYRALQKNSASQFPFDMIVEDDVHIELEDDSIITVADNDKQTASAPANVMSEKVVHAMLDEAKLVCMP